MTAERQSYQQRVARLLEQIDAYSRKRLRLATAGVRQPVLVPLDDKLAFTRAQLEELVGASGRRGRS